MRRTDVLSKRHPLVGFLYFAAVIGCAMFLMHPASLAVSLAGAAAYGFWLHGRRAASMARRYAPVFLLAALLNPAFNHRGVTILTYLPSGNPLTLESIVYGLASAAMLAAVLLWFSCCSAVMRSDKLLWLFGRAAPSLSLLLSMTLRFVPRLRAQFDAVREARSTLGQGRGGNLLSRLREAVTVFSIVLTWALENAVDTADSMKSRGYGLPGRTAFSVYRFDRRDACLLVWLGVCGAVMAGALRHGGGAWQYYPALRAPTSTAAAVFFHIAYAALCLTPLILNLREARTWRSLRSAI